MSAIHTYVSHVGGQGPNATMVRLGTTEDGVRLKAWFPNQVASQLTPGMQITCPDVSFGPVETTQKDGTPLKVSVRQVFFKTKVEIGPGEPTPEVEFVFTQTPSVAEPF